MRSGGAGQTQPGGEVLFEMTALGGQVRVAAIDGATGTEVVVIAPPGLSERQMQSLALTKLRRRLEREGQ